MMKLVDRLTHRSPSGLGQWCLLLLMTCGAIHAAPVKWEVHTALMRIETHPGSHDAYRQPLPMIANCQVANLRVGLGKIDPTTVHVRVFTVTGRELSSSVLYAHLGEPLSVMFDISSLRKDSVGEGLEPIMRYHVVVYIIKGKDPAGRPWTPTIR